MNDHARGALLGLAVGDALGTTLEFTSTRHDPPFITGPHNDIIGGGPFRVAPGQVTDDTQMAVCLAQSIVACGKYDASYAFARYVAWAQHAFDIGSTTSASLRAPQGKANKTSHSNGSLMRIAPMGALLPAPGVCFKAIEDSLLTHANPRCQLACAALSEVIAVCVVHSLGDREGLVALACTVIDRVRPHLVGSKAEITAAYRDTRDALVCGLAPVPPRDGISGDALGALTMAFWQLVHAPDYRTALIDTVNRGGDADTNGAIVGALLGAYYGADAIPIEWRERVLGALSGTSSPWWTAYHPRLFPI